MANRIKQSDLEAIITRINEKNGTPDRKQGGHYYLDMAYGGYKLSQRCETGSGCRNISTGGYGTKRELYLFLQGFQYNF